MRLPYIMAHLSLCLNQYDEQYTSLIRTNLRSFHLNLDAGNWNAIQSSLAPDYYWDYDGTIILSPPAARAALQHVAGTLLGGVHAQDIYNIVDGNRGAALFRITGQQGADFFGVPLQQPPGRYDVRSAERFIFDADGLAREVTTVTPVGLLKEQMQGAVEILPAAEVVLKQSVQTDSTFQGRNRKTLASLHFNVLAGNASANELLAAENVQSDENGVVTTGRDAFAGLISARNAGLGSFPVKAFHDFDILVDGMYGAIDYVWAGLQESEYKGIPAKEGANVKVRGMLFFEFNENGLIEKVVSVYDEGVVATTLSN